MHLTPPYTEGLNRFLFVSGCRGQALEAVNVRLRELYPDSEELFDVVLMTSNHAHVGLRLIHTINHHREWPMGKCTINTCACTDSASVQ